MSKYRPARKAQRMYRHYERYGTAGMTKRQLRALARESDYGVNPRRRRSPEQKYKHALRMSARHHKGIMSFKSRRRKKWLGKQARALRQLRRSRNPLSCRMGKERMFHELKHHASRWRPQKQRVAIVLSTLRKCRGKRRRNPYTFEDALAGRPNTSTYTITSDGERYRVSSRRVSYQDLGSGWYLVAQGVPEREVEGLIRRDQEKVRKSLRDNPRRRNPVFMNPKRDGSMTKGEKRLQKHAEWLRQVADRGRKAQMMLKAMRSVPAASHVAAAEHAADRISSDTIEKAMEGSPAAVAKVEQVVEHAEAKFLRQQIADLTMLINATQEEANALGEADEMMAQELMEQVTKMSKQRKVLKDKAQGLGIQINPRPRRSRRSRRTVLVGLHRYAKALRELRSAILRGRR